MSGVVVVGAGPGIGAAVARRFAGEGMAVGLIARSAATLEATAREVAPFGTTVSARRADVADEGGLRAALREVVGEIGVPDVLVYNAALIRYDNLAELSAFDLMESWAINVVGAVTTAGEMLPRMAEQGGGTVILTGGMPEPLPNVLSLSLGKAGLRAFTEILAAEFGPSGVHVATVTVCGPVAPGSDFDPDEIAEEYWQIHREEPGEWRHRVDYTGAPVEALAR